MRVREQHIGNGTNCILVELNPRSDLLLNGGSGWTTGLRWRLRLVPVNGAPEFAMHAVRRPSEKIESLECLPQYFLCKHSANDSETLDIYVGLRWRVSGDPAWALEVIIIMASATAKCESKRKAGTSPPSAANALLVVKPHWRHIRHHYCQQATNIYARFHRCCYA